MPEIQAILTHNVVSMRAEPHGDSEQVSQGILGDRVLLLEERGEYARISSSDAYDGWVWRRHLRPMSDAYPRDAYWSMDRGLYFAWRVQGPFLPLLAEPDERTLLTQLVCGTWLLPFDNVSHGEDSYHEVRIPSQDADGYRTGYVPLLSVLEESEKPDFNPPKLCFYARQFLGTPYLWGGTTSFGFDCSGFVQRLYSLCNIILPRDAYLQARSPLGRSLSPGETLQPGDLVFFLGPSDPRNRGITHVGMAIDAERFIHAVSKEGVTLTRFDDPYYSRLYAYRGAWRYSFPL